MATRGLASGKGAWLAGLVLLLLASCRVSFPEELPYACARPEDCAGERYVCLNGACCLPEPELCDGRDNDCSGAVDDAPATPCYPGPAETEGVGRCAAGALACEGAVEACRGAVLPVAEECNGLDDDCDGAVDEDFDLKTDDSHCGRCGRPCSPAEDCRAGGCLPVAESACDDGADGDADGRADCADADCEGRACGAGCTCRSASRTESGCGDGADNDSDGNADCADANCADANCGAGCTCAAGGRRETGCADTADNDGDGQADCGDPDCRGLLCRSSPQTFVCGDAGTCTCGGQTTPPQEAHCLDGLDDDCDGLTDCADDGCGTFTADAGWGCRLGRKAELSCDDFADNEGDGRADCLDAADCPVGSACRYQQGPNLRAGTCYADAGCGR